MNKGFEVGVELKDEKDPKKFVTQKIYVAKDVVKFINPSPIGAGIGLISGDVLVTKEGYDDVVEKFES